MGNTGRPHSRPPTHWGASSTCSSHRYVRGTCVSPVLRIARTRKYRCSNSSHCSPANHRASRAPRSNSTPRPCGTPPCTAISWNPGPNLARVGLHVSLPRALPVSGLEVFWNSARRGARLEGRDPAGEWHLLGEDASPLGDTSYLAANSARALSELRLTVYASGRETPAIRRLRLLSRTQAMTTLKRYEIFAGREHSALFPSSLHEQQVYWTAVGVPAGEQKSLFDEYGNLEAFKNAPLVQPLWRDDSGRIVAASNANRTQSLREGWMPMPTVVWSPQPGLQLRSEAIAITTAAGPATLVRYRLENSGPRAVDGQLALLVRPIQVNPSWQHGGISEIHTVGFEGTGENTLLVVNGRTLLTSVTAPLPRAWHRSAPRGRLRSLAMSQKVACRPHLSSKTRPASGLLHCSMRCISRRASRPMWCSCSRSENSRRTPLRAPHPQRSEQSVG